MTMMRPLFAKSFVSWERFTLASISRITSTPRPFVTASPDLRCGQAFELAVVPLGEVPVLDIRKLPAAERFAALRGKSAKTVLALPAGRDRADGHPLSDHEPGDDAVLAIRGGVATAGPVLLVVTAPSMSGVRTTPDDVAALASFVLSPDAAMITGQTKSRHSSTSPALKACAARCAPPTVRSLVAEAFMRRTDAGSKRCSSRVFAVGTAARVVE